MFRMWDVLNLECLECRMFAMCDVQGMEFSGSGVFRVLEVRNVRCLRCEIFRMWDVQ